MSQVRWGLAIHAVKFPCRTYTDVDHGKRAPNKLLKNKEEEEILQLGELERI
jgi:hypothetical protein